MAPVLANESTISGYSSGASNNTSVATVVLTTYGGAGLVYLAITIHSPTVQVASVNDSSGLSWTQRTSVTTGNLSLVTWYALSTVTLDRDTITAHLTASVDAVAVGLGISHIASSSSPFEGSPVFEKGTSAVPAVSLNTTGPAVVVGALGVSGQVYANTSNGFELEDERSSSATTSALESTRNYRVCAVNCSPSGSGDLIGQIVPAYQLPVNASWAMVGDAVAVSLPSFPHFTPTNGSAPVVATCAQGTNLIPGTYSDHSFADWNQAEAEAQANGSTVLTGIGDGYATFTANGATCSAGDAGVVDINGSYYFVTAFVVVVYNNGTQPTPYAIQSFVTSQKNLGTILPQMDRVASTQSSPGGGNQYVGDWELYSGVLGDLFSPVSLSYSSQLSIDTEEFDSYEVTSSGAITGFGSFTGDVSWSASFQTGSVFSPGCGGWASADIPFQGYATMTGQVDSQGDAAIQEIVHSSTIASSVDWTIFCPTPGSSGGFGFSQVSGSISLAGFDSPQTLAFDVQVTNGFSQVEPLASPWSGVVSISLTHVSSTPSPP